MSSFLLGLAIAPSIGIHASAAADSVVITAVSPAQWESGGQQSSFGGDPLQVEVSRGDTIEIRVPNGGHGFVTISGAGDQSPSEKKDLVQVCGQSNDAAVLREIECKDPPDGFFGDDGKGFTGTLKLQVTDRFSDDVNFWCTVHTDGMWGILKLKPQTP